MNFFSRAALAAIALFVAGQASAASISYFLDESNDLAGGVNYAQVTISDGIGGNIDFKVEVIQSAFPSPLTNFGMQAFFFNYDQSLTVSKTNIVNIDPASWAILEDKNAGGGFGKFQLEAAGSGSTRTSLLTFSISGVSGDTVNSYALGNAEMGEFFAAHIAGYDASVSGNTSGKFAGSTAVPVPAAVWLFGSALGMLAWSRRRAV